MKREIKFRAFLNSKYYENPCMLSWEELLEQYDVIDMFQRDLMTLMQFTGLKDVNGKDIYEGDIVGYTRWADHVGIVRYFKPEFELQNIGLNIDIAPTLTMRHELIIIGNIHENPELLEDEK